MGHSLMVEANLKAGVFEALAALEALRLVRCLGFGRVIVEGDSKNIIAALQTEGPNFYSVRNIVSEARKVAD